MRYLIVLFVFILIAHQAAAQQIPVRAQRLFMEANRLRALKKQDAACKMMEKAIAAYPAYTDAYSTLGTWYFQSHRFAEAVKVFEQASNNCPKGRRDFALPLARSYAFNYRIGEALQLINAAPNDSNWGKLRRQVAFMSHALNSSWKDTVFNSGRVNTAQAEMFPSVSADEQTLYFMRRFKGEDEDLYTAKADSCGGWFMGRNAGKILNTTQQEAAQMISADGHYLFFTRCDNRSPNGWAQGGCDLYMAYRKDDSTPWSAAESFGATINTPGYEGMPCLSSDNRELFFVSNREGGYGGLDIWSSKFEDGLWQAPRNLGPEINTAGDEAAPFLYADNQTLYFSSTGHEGMGGSDFFMSRRSQDTVWSKPLNLGYPINTPYDETGFALNIEGTRAWFSSDRDSLAGNFDIYEMKLPASLAPQPVSFVKGYVYDSISKAPLNYANISIKDVATGKESYLYRSNRGDGSYMFVLRPGVAYSISVARIAFQGHTDTIQPDKGQLSTPMQYNVSMLPYNYERPILDSVVLSVYFKKSIITIADSAKQMILQTMAAWKGKGSVVQVLINGYTDNSGTPILNEQLSTQRAGLVRDIIYSLGFEKDFMQVQGWGEASPVSDNETDEGRDRNRRVEIVVREYQ